MTQHRITLTGADERTDLDGLRELITRSPMVEIGLLYTTTPEGRNRYPSRQWLQSAAKALSGRVAIHVCGRGARKELSEGTLAFLTHHAPRVQVNGHLEIEEAEHLATRVGTLLTQHNARNSHLLDVRASNHAVLIDASGGQGISPETWSPPETAKTVGFAGGLGLDNLAHELEQIALVARPGHWVDMEGKLRQNDWFDLATATLCADIHQNLQNL